MATASAGANAPAKSKDARVRATYGLTTAPSAPGANAAREEKCVTSQFDNTRLPAVTGVNNIPLHAELTPSSIMLLLSRRPKPPALVRERSLDALEVTTAPAVSSRLPPIPLRVAARGSPLAGGPLFAATQPGGACNSPATTLQTDAKQRKPALPPEGVGLVPLTKTRKAAVKQRSNSCKEFVFLRSVGSMKRKWLVEDADYMRDQIGVLQRGSTWLRKTLDQISPDELYEMRQVASKSVPPGHSGHNRQVGDAMAQQRHRSRIGTVPDSTSKNCTGQVRALQLQMMALPKVLDGNEPDGSGLEASRPQEEPQTSYMVNHREEFKPLHDRFCRVRGSTVDFN